MELSWCWKRDWEEEGDNNCTQTSTTHDSEWNSFSSTMYFNIMKLIMYSDLQKGCKEEEITDQVFAMIVLLSIEYPIRISLRMLTTSPRPNQRTTMKRKLNEFFLLIVFSSIFPLHSCRWGCFKQHQKDGIQCNKKAETIEFRQVSFQSRTKKAKWIMIAIELLCAFFFSSQNNE